MERYLNLIQKLYTVNHNSGIESYFNATSIYDHDFAPLLSQQSMNSSLSLTLVLSLIESFLSWS